MQCANKGGALGSLLRSLLAVSIVVILAAIVIRNNLYITSDQAFINTKLVTLRSPLTGVVDLAGRSIGSIIEKDQVIFRMTNPRYGNSEASSQFNNLQNLIDTVKNEISHNELYIKRYELDFRRFEQLKEVGGVALRDFEEIDNELKVLRATGRNKKEQLAHLEQRFQEVERQLELQKFCEVTAPCRGVVWSILVKDGEHVNMGEEVVQLVNCETVWVDAFFNERYAGKLRPGMKVKVKPVGSNENWDGEIVFIRGGSGRIMYGAAVEVPPTVLSRRLVAVRVKVDWKGKGFRESEFYGIGRSLIVSYRKEPRFFSWIK